MEKKDLTEALRRYITEEFLPDPAYQLGDDEPLVSGGLIDSFALVHIGTYVEDAFGVFIPDSDLSAENLDTLSVMADLILELKR